MLFELRLDLDTVDLNLDVTLVSKKRRPRLDAAMPMAGTRPSRCHSGPYAEQSRRSAEHQMHF